MNKIVFFRIMLIMSFVVMWLATSHSHGQENYNGYKDTVIVHGFKATDDSVTKAFDGTVGIGMYRFVVFANDTSSAGFSADSINFVWGVQQGIPVINSSGKKDTAWLYKLMVDTFDISTDGNMVVPVVSADSLLEYNKCTKFIDTVNVTGWAVQSKEVDNTTTVMPLFRFWYSGKSKNKTGSFVRLMFAMLRKSEYYMR